jgi:hypothetical protein
MESIALIWSLKRPNACKSQERRAVLGLYPRPVVLARHDYIYFLFYKKTYVHIYNLYLILKTSEHDVLLVRHSIRAWVQSPPPALFFNILRRFNQMGQRSNGLAWHS